MTTYNGRKNWNYWNVSLWINNDEFLYQLAERCLQECGGRKLAAAQQMLDALRDFRQHKTPDGVAYNKANILAAMRGLQRSTGDRTHGTIHQI